MRRSPRHRRHDRYRRRRRKRQNRRRTHVAAARGSEHTARRGRATSPARDDGRIRGRSRRRRPLPYRARRRASIRLDPWAEPDTAESTPHATSPRPAAPTAPPAGAAQPRRPAATVYPWAEPATPSGPGSRPAARRALDRSVGGAVGGAGSRIALDDAAALGAGQGDRHRLVGALERGLVALAVAAGARAAWCRPRGRGSTSRDHG